MTGWLRIIGLGPGAKGLIAPDAIAALDAAEAVFGYGPYLARLSLRADQRGVASDNREEIARARDALAMAAAGARVAIVSSGDAGVFAMASATFEALEAGDPAWRALDIAVVPGISAVLAAAARAGAPLGHDFCVLSLSDNLKPWPLILRRLMLAAEADFVIALYNPASRARPWQLAAALTSLRERLPPSVPVVFATAVSRADEQIVTTTLEEADPSLADMRTLVLIGSRATRRITRADGGAWLYTPRSAPAETPETTRAA